MRFAELNVAKCEIVLALLEEMQDGVGMTDKTQIEDIGTVAWDTFDKEGYQTGECKIHVANWKAGKTLCGIDLFPASGPRQGWGRHSYYESNCDVGTTCCERCHRAKEKIEDSAENANQSKDKPVQSQGGKWLTPIQGEEDVWCEDVVPGEVFYRIYYKGDRDFTEVDEGAYRSFRSQIKLHFN